MKLIISSKSCKIYAKNHIKYSKKKKKPGHRYMHKILWHDSKDLGQGRDSMQTVPSSLFISRRMAAGSLSSPRAQPEEAAANVPLLAFPYLHFLERMLQTHNLVPYNIGILTERWANCSCVN